MSIELIQERRGGNGQVSPNPKWIFPERMYECRVLICPEDDGGYSAHALRLPGVVSQGGTVEAAIENVRDAFQAVIQAYLEAGGTIPWTQNEQVERPNGSLERWILVNA